jgi:hypothetical protein
MVADRKCSGIRDLIGLEDHQSCSTVMIGGAASMADRCTLSRAVKRTVPGVREAEISRRSAEGNSTLYYPYLEVDDSETDLLSRRSEP